MDEVRVDLDGGVDLLHHTEASLPALALLFLLLLGRLLQVGELGLVLLRLHSRLQVPHIS